MDKMKWMARGALAAATAGVLAFAATADMGYDYPVGDPEISALLPANTAYYSTGGSEGFYGMYEVVAYDKDENMVCDLLFGDIKDREGSRKSPEVDSRIEMFYDSKGRLTATETTDENGLERMEVTYDEQDREISRVSPSRVIETAYGEDGRSKTIVTTDNEGDQNTMYLEWDEQENETYTCMNFSDERLGKIESWYEYEYDAAGNAIKRTTYSEPGGEPSTVATYTYEGENLTGMHLEGYLGGEQVLDMTYRYTYDEYGHQIVQETVGTDGEASRSFKTYYLPAAK